MYKYITYILFSIPIKLCYYKENKIQYKILIFNKINKY